MADFNIMTGDTVPPLIRVLNETIDGVLTPIDLTTALEVKVILNSGGITKTGVCTITNAAGGEVSYEWAAGDTDTAGSYVGEHEIKWPGPEYETVPNDADNRFTVEIGNDLGGSV